MHSTVVFGALLASALNLRTEVAQVGVSMLGKMFSTSRWPLKSAGVAALRSVRVRLKAGAWLPTRGSSPAVWMGLPLRVT